MADGGERGGGEAQRPPSSGGSSVLHLRDDLDSYLKDILEPWMKARGVDNPCPTSYTPVVPSGRPKYSFGGKNISRDAVPTGSATPGPGTYDAVDVIGKKKATTTHVERPRAFIGTSDRFWEGDNLYNGPVTAFFSGAPGPGAHDQPSLIGRDAQAHAFPRTARPAPGEVIGQERNTTPGPGAYASENDSSMGPQVSSTKATSPIVNIGHSTRDVYSRQYNGPGVEPPSTGLNPGFTYSGGVASVGAQAVSTRASSPCFSFGATSPRKYPRNFRAIMSEKRRRAEEMTRSLRRKWNRASGNASTPTSVGSVKSDDGTRRARTASPARRRDYSWLREGAEPRRSAKYKYKTHADGCELSRGREYKKLPSFSFGSTGRFQDDHATASPGPKYMVPSRLGDAPVTSFPKSSRQGPDSDYKERIDKHTPGPGQYDVVVDYRLQTESNVAALLRELENEGLPDDELLDEVCYSSTSVPNAVRAASTAKHTRERQRRLQPYAEKARQQRLPNVSPVKRSATPGEGRVSESPGQSPLARPFTSTAAASPLSITRASGTQRFQRSQRHGGGAGDSHVEEGLAAASLAVTPAKFGNFPTRSASPRTHFMSATREVQRGLFVPGELNNARLGLDSPGPTHNTFGTSQITGRRSPAFSFGATFVHDKKSGTLGPGPAGYDSSLGMFKQVDGQHRSAPAPVFPKTSREKGRKVFSPGFEYPGLASPGPVYPRVDSMGTQQDGRYPTSARTAFGKEVRKLNEVPKEAALVPGPGTYGKHETFRPLGKRKGKKKGRSKKKQQQQVQAAET